MPKTGTDLLADVAGYYASRLAQHSDTPQGVDWNSLEGQTLRFAQLCRIVEKTDNFSVNDLGCGYGALYEYLSQRYGSFAYFGVDVAQEMVKAARRRYAGQPNVRFDQAGLPTEVADYGIASGIFNVRLGRSKDQWQRHFEDTLD